MPAMPKHNLSMIPAHLAGQAIRCQSTPYNRGEFRPREVAKAWRRAGKPAEFYVCFAASGRRGVEVHPVEGGYILYPGLKWPQL
jgi:hypothetical protein